MLDDLARVESLLSRAERGETLPVYEQIWALNRLRGHLVACRDVLAAERRDFGASPGTGKERGE